MGNLATFRMNVRSIPCGPDGTANDTVRFVMAFVEIIELHRCREGAGTYVEHGGLGLAVLRPPGSEEIVVLDNACPHAGGNLSGGAVSGHTVTCPWHQWEVDLRTGVCTHSQRASVQRYTAKVDDGMICVNLPG